MDKEKQMYNDLIEIFDEEYGKRNLITPQNTAEKLTAKGYRKSEDVAREIFEEIEKTLKECLWFLENHPSNYPSMDRTKINAYKDNLQYIAELKKKYTESEDFIPAPPHTCQVEIPKYYESIINQAFPESENNNE